MDELCGELPAPEHGLQVAVRTVWQLTWQGTGSLMIDCYPANG